MAEKKPSGFRFRLPWLLQPVMAPQVTSAPEPPSQPPRTTTQTSVASTSAQRPPFRPPGKAQPPTVAAQPPASPTRSPPQSAPSPVTVVSPPPQPTVPAKSSVSKSPIAKTLDSPGTQPTKETQTTTETIQTGEIPTPAAVGKTTDSVETQPTKETETTTGAIPTTIETPPHPATPPQRLPFRLTQSQPSPPQTPPPVKPKPDSQPSSPSQFRVSSHLVSPSRMPTPPPNSPPLSPSRLAAEPHRAAPPRATSQPPSPVHVQPSPTRTPNRSPSRLAAQPTDKTSPLPSPTSTPPGSPSRLASKPAEKTSSLPSTPEIKRSTEKPKEMTKTEVNGAQTKSMNPYSMEKTLETKLKKPKSVIVAQAPLHREIRDDISKLIHKMSTNPPKQYTDEQPASVITLAGDNRGASMDLRSGAIDIQRGYKLISDRTVHDATINGEGSSDGKKSQRDSRGSENRETKAIVNSNIQGINNSMMFNSSVSERNPGVRLRFSRIVARTNDSKIKNTESMEMHRAEANITSPQKLIYDPTIGGPFMETNDSEADDPEMCATGYEIEVL